MNNTLVQKISGELSNDGKLFMQHAHGFGGQLLDIDLNHYDGETDDLANPIVHVRSKIGMAERMRRFGIECLGSRNDWSGKCGPQGHPIPTEDYIQRVSTAYNDHHDTRTISADQYRRSGTVAAINRAGRELRELIEQGEFEIVP